MTWTCVSPRLSMYLWIPWLWYIDKYLSTASAANYCVDPLKQAFILRIHNRLNRFIGRLHEINNLSKSVKEKRDNLWWSSVSMSSQRRYVCTAGRVVTYVGDLSVEYADWRIVIASSSWNISWLVGETWLKSYISQCIPNAQMLQRRRYHCVCLIRILGTCRSEFELRSKPKYFLLKRNEQG